MRIEKKERNGDLAITTEALADGVHLFELAGELDSVSAERLQVALDDAIDRGAGRILLDLSGLAFCDSTGLMAIVATYHRLTMAGGRLAIVCDDNRILRVFRITRLDRLLGVCGTRAEALERFDATTRSRRWRRFDASAPTAAT